MTILLQISLQKNFALYCGAFDGVDFGYIQNKIDLGVMLIVTV